MATVKQKVAFKEVLKGSTLTKAMKVAKYADTTASTTGKLTNTKGWAELTEEFISDKALAKVHKEGLNAKTWFSEGLGRGETQLVEKPDYSVRHKYLESGYKLKGRYKENTTNNSLIIFIPNESANRYAVHVSPDASTSSERPSQV